MLLITLNRFRHTRYCPLHAGLLTMVFGLMMGGSGFAFEQHFLAVSLREIRFGLAAHDVDGLWSSDSKEEGPNICAEAILKHTLFILLSATAHPNVGVNFNTQGDTSKVYAGFLLQWESDSALFFSTGLGLALHNGETDVRSDQKKSLGSRLLFRIPIEVGYAFDRHHRIIFAFDHLSNGYLASPNEGMDSLGLIYGYRF
jgi:hypothetical protein